LDGTAPDDFFDVNTALLLDDIKTVTVDRSGQTLNLELPDDFGQMMVDSGTKFPFIPRIPAVVDSIIVGGTAEKAGMLKGDVVTEIDGTAIAFYNDITPTLSDKNGQEIPIAVERNGQSMTLAVEVSDDGKIGVGPVSFEDAFEMEHVDYTLGQSIPAGFDLANRKLRQYIVSMKFIFSKAGVKQIGGFGTIGSLYPSTWNWEAIWITTAFLSLILAFMNILPIPALDGGHVMFLLWEIISGKPPGDKFLERAQIVGMVLLLGLLLFANGNDILRLFD
jgi:regulator of sigma E protease